MNTTLTEIAFILDRSGSMSNMTEAAIAGFNDFLKAQQAAPGDARLTLVLFDNEYLVHAEAQPLGEVTPLDTNSYVPRATTALLDAIGRTVDELGTRLAAMPESERPGNVVVAILTDGLENASEHYTWRDIAKKIRHQTNVYQWEFLFLGANQDAIATAAQMGIASANAATYTHDATGYASSSKAFARKVAALRAMKGREAFEAASPFGSNGASGDVSPFAASSPFATDAKADLSDLLKEEEEKERH